MSTYDDRREARKYEIGDGDLEPPLVRRNGRIALKIDDKSPLSVGVRGLQMNVDDDTIKVKPGSPYRISATAPVPEASEDWYPKELGFVDW